MSGTCMPVIWCFVMPAMSCIAVIKIYSPYMSGTCMPVIWCYVMPAMSCIAVIIKINSPYILSGVIKICCWYFLVLSCANSVL
jgi:hypothetical protein